MSFNVPKTEQKRVVIVGGGFGGLRLANRLRHSDFQVVLVDRNNYHQFPPLIYQIASAGIEPSHSGWVVSAAAPGAKRIPLPVFSP